MKRNRTLSALCVSVALVFASGCAPDAETISGPDPQFSKGHAAGGVLAVFREVVTFDVIPSGENAPCEFPVRFVGVDKLVFQAFQTHLVIHVNSTATVTTPLNNVSFMDNEAFTQIVHFDDGSVTVNGAPIKITLQGEGMLFQDTGTITFDGGTGEVFFEGGPHEIFHGANPCDVLAAG